MHEGPNCVAFKGSVHGSGEDGTANRSGGAA